MALGTRTKQQDSMQIVMIRVAALIPHHQNVREDINPELEELAESIKRHGVLQPLTIMPAPSNQGGVEYTIIAGHRRARASMLAGLSVVPCIIKQKVAKDEQTILMLTENTQRKDLNPMEQALALSSLILAGKSQKELAQMLGRSQPWVSNRLGFLDLSEATQRRLARGEIPISQAEHLVRQSRKQAGSKNEKKHDRGWVPPYLTTTHPLAKKVKEMCNSRQHNGRQRVGSVGCGQCWEWAIRNDERKVVETEQRMAAAEG